ncbi:MAG: hypothetical protein A3K68_00810 [Euryarchaeota archaeon RBG_16_68_13]|nr:MAG: hypothetical protein A3K68_00810 [Euryarchaeota archaeon RBG_16_68_13]
MAQNPIAFLVDGDNASFELVGEMLAEASKYGAVVIRRVYGDWSSTRMTGWRKGLAEHALVPIQQFPNISRKNATDSAMIIDAMDILHSEVVKGFCIVSSDSDYTRLATRVREAGLLVMGIGEAKTPEAFRRSCHVFVLTENLEPPETPASPATHRQQPRNPRDALQILRRAFDNVAGDEDRVHLGALADALRKLDSAFDPRTYGKSKLVDLMLALPDTFAVERPHKPGIGAVYVRRKGA